MSSFTLAPVLSEKQLDAVDNAALDILEKVGLLVPHAEVLDELRSKPGVRIDGETVRLDRSLVRETIENTTGSGQYDTHEIAGAYSHYYLDPDTNEVRLATLDDLIKSIKLADVLGMGVCAPVVPLDVPGPQQELVMERLTHEYSRYSYGAGQATSAPAAEASLVMHKLVGRPHSLELWINSPLKMDGKGLDIVWKLRHLSPGVSVCSMPVRGQSGPIYVSGLLAQSAAESFGAITVVSLLGVGPDIAFRQDAFTAYAVDMMSGNVLLSGPESLQLLILRVQTAKRHGIAAPMAKGLLTQAKMPGVQAAAEKMAQSLAMEMAETHCHLAAGTLSSVETFSPIQLIIDKELMSWISAVMKPVRFSEDEFSIDIIKEVGPGGTFFSHESTAQHAREVAWKPELFSLNAYQSWVAEGMPSAIERARDVLNSVELTDEPAVSPETQRELHRIEKEYMARL